MTIIVYSGHTTPHSSDTYTLRYHYKHHCISGLLKILQKGSITFLPFAFTEYGVAMLSSVLNSEQAISTNIIIIKTFIRLKEILYSNKELERRIQSLEEKVEVQFELVFQEFENMKQTESIPRVRIGYRISGQEEQTQQFVTRHSLSFL